MKNSKEIVVLLLLCACQLVPAATGLSQYGSNPYQTYLLFPQDMSAWQGNFLSYNPSYENQPYWGDIDEPGKKPNGTYTSTGVNTIKNAARFSDNAQINSMGNSFAYNHRFSNGVSANLAFDYNVESRGTAASGNLSRGTVQFDYSMAHTLNTLRLQGITGFTAFGVPVGIILSGGFVNTLALNHSFAITKIDTLTNETVHYSTDRATWGWTTSPCAHIFGALGPEGDSWLQNDYARGPLYSVHLQIGASLPIAKIGGQFTYQTGHQDYYAWQADTNNFLYHSKLDSNFVGSYHKDDWSRIIQNGIGQLYGSIPVIKSDRYSLNAFALVGYEGGYSGYALSSNPSVENGDKEKTHDITVEAAPYISIPFGSIFSYIDAGVHLEYRYGRIDNTYMRWVGGGQIEAHRETQTSNADEYAWEGFSYANNNNFDAGIDINPMFPLYAQNGSNVGLGLLIGIGARYSYMAKYYGNNTVSGTDISFTVDKKRLDTEKEIRFDAGLKVQYQQHPILAWLEFSEPVLRSFTPRTRVTDATGKTVLFDHEKEPLWMSLEGIRVGIFAAYEWTLPVLQGI